VYACVARRREREETERMSRDVPLVLEYVLAHIDLGRLCVMHGIPERWNQKGAEPGAGWENRRRTTS
jgi:hypothetical protein